MPILDDGRVVFDATDTLPPVARSLSSMAWNATGVWRSREPVFGDIRPPCAAACPAGEDIVDQIRLFAQRRVREAGELLLCANPFPATTGRVCPHPCTAVCNRMRLGGSVDVPGIERAIGDALLDSPSTPAANRPVRGRVAVVGAGPAGLTAAHFLSRDGHVVTVYDRDERPGGLLRMGIPPYRLPRDVLDREIARALGQATFVGGQALGAALTLRELKSEFDAVLLCLGRHAPRSLDVTGEDPSSVLHGLDLLAALHRGEPAPAGERVIVVGGGNTAIDCARSLVRLGKEVMVAYRRDRAAMPASADEVEEALEEGVRIIEWVAPIAVAREEGLVQGLRLVCTRPGAKDASGRPRPEPVLGSEFLLKADLVVGAVGEGLNATGLPAVLFTNGSVSIDHTFETPIDNVFSCGDCAGGAGTVANAIGQGRQAAGAIARRLGTAGPTVDFLRERGVADEIAGPDHIRKAYFTRIAATPRGRVKSTHRRNGVAVRLGFGVDAAHLEAARCLGCGTCTGCDLCFHYCGDRAVVRGEPGRYSVDISRCKGCGVCVEECPRGAVRLREVGVSA